MIRGKLDFVLVFHKNKAMLTNVKQNKKRNKKKLTKFNALLDFSWYFNRVVYPNESWNNDLEPILLNLLSAEGIRLSTLGSMDCWD